MIRELISLTKELRNEAEGLENDYLVSIAEGIANETFAKRLREYADKLERIISG